MFVIIAQNLYIAKVCEVNLGYDKTICDNITNYKQQQVSAESSIISIWYKNNFDYNSHSRLKYKSIQLSFRLTVEYCK